MKKNPAVKYGAIVAVVLIWGLIIYKVIAAMHQSDVQAPVSTYIPKLQPADTVFNYTLFRNNYPDPFNNALPVIDNDNPYGLSDKAQPATGGNQPSQNTPNIQSLNPPIPAAVMATPEPPPSIKYNGYIFNPKTKKRTALISYNGRSMTVGVADRLDEKTRILKIEDQQLTFSFKGRRIVVGIGG